jgi:hypothetical protein
MSSECRYAATRTAPLSDYVQALEKAISGAGFTSACRNPQQQTPMERFCGEGVKEQCSVIALETGVGKLNISESFGVERE